MKNTVKKVLLITPQASEAFGGEAMLPVQYFRHLPAAGIEVAMIVHERARRELEGLFPGRQDQIHFVKDSWLHRLLYRCGRLLPQRIASFTTVFAVDLLTERAQKRIALQLIRKERIDLVHVPIRVSPRLPSSIHNLGRPVVFGPLNGGMTFPDGFVHQQAWLEKAFMDAGRTLSHLANRFIPGKPRATTVVVANARTRKALPVTTGMKIVELVENGVDLSLFQARPARKRQASDSCRFVFLGRLVDWKCVDMLLEAMARLNSAGLAPELEIIGDGPERPALERLSNTLGLSQQVRFRGFVPQRDCPAQLAQCDCLVLPSMYECGGAVVLEAMAMGRPVIATNWGGPADYLDAACGMLVDPGNGRRDFIVRLAEAMRAIIADPAGAEAMGAAGRAKVTRQFDWSKKAGKMVEVYAATLKAGQSPRCKVPLPEKAITRCG